MTALAEAPDIFLVRHGETTWNRIGRHQGQLNSVLTLEGVRQAEAVGRRLGREISDWRDVRIFCSPLFRCQQTAAGACDAAGVDVERIVYDERLQERHFGEWQGLTDAEITARFPEEWAARQRDLWNYVIPGGGENYETLERRLGDWLAEQEAGQRIVLVTHGQAGRALRRRYLGLAPDQALALPEPQDAVIHLRGGEARTLDGDF